MIATDSTQRASASTRWPVEADGSTVDFTVKTLWGLATVRGRFDRFEGCYEVGPDGANIELLIDADSINTGNRTRDRHLRSADFFGITDHPLVRFSSTSVRDASDGMLHVEGLLDAAGTVVPLRFDAAVQEVEGHLQVEATTTVDHRRFGMQSGLLGMIRPPARVHVNARLSEPTREHVAAGLSAALTVELDTAQRSCWPPSMS
jgi:polyisoprenoid-binding protein YceI